MSRCHSFYHFEDGRRIEWDEFQLRVGDFMLYLERDFGSGHPSDSNGTFTIRGGTDFSPGPAQHTFHLGRWRLIVGWLEK